MKNNEDGNAPTESLNQLTDTFPHPFGLCRTLNFPLRISVPPAVWEQEGPVAKATHTFRVILSGPVKAEAVREMRQAEIEGGVVTIGGNKRHFVGVWIQGTSSD